MKQNYCLIIIFPTVQKKPIMKYQGLKNWKNKNKLNVKSQRLMGDMKDRNGRMSLCLF